MVDGTPEIMRLAVDAHEYLVHAPASLRITPLLNPALADLRREDRAEAISRETHRLMADVDSPFDQDVLDLTQGQRMPDMQHHRQADHLG